MIEDDQQALNGMNCENAAARMEALERFDILDTERDAVFDSIAVLAAALLDTPIAVVNFITDDRQFFKAEIGIGTRELPLDVSICRFALPEGGLFVIPDLTTDRRFDNNPLVHVEEGLRFYAGYVLESAGVPLGTVCVLDRAPRPQGLTDAQEMGLKALGVQTLAALERSAEARRDRFTLALTEKMWDADGPVEMMGMATAHLGQYLRVSQVGFAEVDSDQAHLRVDRDWSTGPIASVVGRWHMDDFGETSILAMKAGQTLVIDDILTDSRTNGPVASASYAALGARSVVVVPLVSAGLLVATLFIHHNEPRVWHKDEIALIEDTAARLWGAVLRARADADVKTRSRELETLIGTAPIGFAYFDRAHRYLRINEELAAINGLPADDHIGVSIDDLLPTNAKAVSPILDTVFATGKVAKTIEISGDTPLLPGIERHWLTSWFPVFDDHDVIASVGTWVVEITERRRAEDAQRASEAQLQQAQALGGIGSWQWNHAAGEGSVSASYRTIHGLADSNAPLTEDELFGVMHPDDQRVFREIVLDAIATGNRFKVEYRITLPDGQMRIIRGVGQRIETSGHAITAGIVEDVTERRAIEEQLRETSQRLNAVLDNASVSIFLMDDRQHCAYMNRAAEEMTGYTLAETQGRPLHDIVHHSYPDGRPFPLEECAIDRAFPENANMRGEEVFVHKDGSFYPVAYVASPIRDESSRTVGTIVEVRNIGSEKAAAQALADSEIRYRAVFEQAGVGVARVSLDGPFLEVNDRYCAILGRSREELLNGGWKELTHPDDLAEDVANVERLFVGGVTEYTMDKRYVGKNGKEIWVTLTVSLVRDARGEPAFFVAVAEDIAARKYAEFALSDSEARLRAVIDAAPVGLIFANADGEITGGNAKVEEIIGHSVLPSPDDDAPVRWISFHPDGRQVQRLEYPLASVILGEADRAALDVLYQRGDGRKAWVRFVAAAMRNANGALIGGVVASLDIDREKRLTDQLEQEVQVAVAERDRLWETAEDLLKIAEFDGTIIAINPAWATALGWSDTELVGSKFWGLIHPDDLPSVEALVRTLTNGEKSAARFECRYRAKNGKWHYLAWSVSSAAGVLNGVARDITIDKARQNDLELAHAQLHEAQKLETIGQLTGGVAHDFNNLLTPIMGVLDIMERRVGDDERMSRLVSGALQSAERAKNLIQRLLSFARRQHLETKAVDLEALIESMRDLIDRSIGPAIVVEVDFESPLCPVKADPNQLELALLNLSVNARDAMPSGGTLRFNARQETVSPDSGSELAAGSYVCLTVSDTGCGMDGDTLRRCIEPFYTSKIVGEGTGLGLSMVHGMMRQLNGALIITSEPGVGTDMELWLPCSDGATQTDIIGEPVLRMAPRRSTILLVDDDELVRESTADMLAHLDYDVVQAKDGVQALELLGGSITIDAMVTDYLMPGMTGRELAELARRVRPNLPVLLITGYTRLDEIEPELPRLEKPFRQAEFAERIAELVTKY